LTLPPLTFDEVSKTKMSAPKNYTVGAMVGKEDEAAIAEILKKNPLWKRKHARELIARRKFQHRITAQTQYLS